MKHSSTWFALILIASALFLNGVISAKADPLQIPSPQASGTAKSPTSSDNAQQQNSRPPTSGVTSPELRQTIPPTQNAHDQNEQSEALDLTLRLTDYTGSLATYTALLVVVGVSSVLIALLQGALFFISIQEYVRPKVRIRTLTMVNDLPTRMDDKAPFRFALVLVNHGGTRAKIKSGNFTIRLDPIEEVPTWGYGEPAYRPPHEFLKGEIIPCGPEATFDETAERAYSEREIRELIDQKMFLHVVGYIWYKGRLPLRGYKTSFCRRYDVTQEKLIVSGGEEFNFED